MYKLAIVEDDQLYRHEIRTILNWEAYGFAICWEAINGRQALKRMEEEVPDLLFTDISMPGMNGIALIEAVRAQYPDVEIYVLSAYDDFAFVKDALKLGAKDYILKYAMEREDIEDIVMKTEAAIRARDLRSEDGTFLEVNKYRIAHEYLRDILRGQPEEPELLKKHLSILQVRSDRLYLMVADIFFYHIQDDERIGFMNRENLTYPSSDIVLKVSDAEYALISVFADDESQKVILENTLRTLRGFADVFNQRRGQSFSIGLSDIYSAWSELRAAYRQAAFAREQKFYRGYGKLLRGYRMLTHSHPLFDHIYESTLEEAITEMRMEDAGRLVHDHLIEGETSGLSEGAIQEDLLSHLELLYRISLMEKVPYTSVCDANSVTPVLLEDMDLRETAELKICSFIERLITCMSHWNTCTGSESREISVIRQFIEKNYMRGITLEDLAEELNYTPSYISRLFRKHTGIRIKEYINQVRIEHAKHLIRTTSLKIYEVAERTGFTRVSYLCTVFKEQTGMTISEFKASL